MQSERSKAKLLLSVVPDFHCVSQLQMSTIPDTFRQFPIPVLIVGTVIPTLELTVSMVCLYCNSTDLKRVSLIHAAGAYESRGRFRGLLFGSTAGALPRTLSRDEPKSALCRCHPFVCHNYVPYLIALPRLDLPCSQHRTDVLCLFC
jgi:hypothetical protein